LPQRQQLPVTKDFLEGLPRHELLAGLGDRPLTEVLATLRPPVVQSAVEETLANWPNYGTGRRG
jgi:hypothetical protein